MAHPHAAERASSVAFTRRVARVSFVPMTRFAVALAVLLAQDPKVPVPSDDALSKAEKSVREQFKDEAPLKLARRLWEQARETKDNDSLRYVLFREAADLAARAGAVDTMVGSLAELYAAYDIPGVALKESFHVRIEAHVKAEDMRRLAEADLNLVQEAMVHDQYDIASKMAQAALSLGRKSKDDALVTRAAAAGRSVKEMTAAFEKARKAEEALAAAPEDPAANQLWGEWLCLVKGRWDKGLPFLTKGPDGPLRTAAVREFSSSSDVASLVDVADGWWDLAEREKTPARKAQLLLHARSVYASALPRSAGLIRAKIGKRLEEAPAKEPSGKEEEEALKAEAALAANPNDPAANLTLGKYLAFQKNEWAAAIPRLAKGSDAVLRSVAERELARPGTGAEKVDAGDAWAEAAKKLPALKRNLQDRAAWWYVQAWPSVDGAAKDGLRDRFRKAFQPGGAVSKAPPREWTVPEGKSGVSPAAPRTGSKAFQIAGARIVTALSQSAAARPLASYELSCWVLTDGTDSAEDKLFVTVTSADSRVAVQPSAMAAADQPWYKRLEVRFTAPETAAKMTVGFAVMSTRGTIFIDDVSLKQDGRELLKNGSFEQ